MKITERFTSQGCAEVVTMLSDADRDAALRHSWELVPAAGRGCGFRTLRDQVTVEEAEELCAKAGALLA